jgi:UPF0755 protein
MSQLEQFMTSGDLPPSRHSAPGLRIVLGIVVVLVVGALVALGFIVLRGSQGADDYAGSGTGSVSVVIKSGSTLTQMGQVLAKADVVKSSAAFVAAAAGNPRSSSIGPGKYTMRAQMSGASAVDLMLDPASHAGSRLVLPEGLRLTQTVQAASEASGIASKEFTAVLENPKNLGLPTWAKNRPEGFLFPATYALTGEDTATSLLTSFVKRFNQASAGLNLEANAAKIGRTPYQVLKVASLLQAEGSPADFAKVARVIYNRLDKGMPLQLDSTVSYALGKIDIQLNAQELKTDSPYNTYINTGLPPTPINSPGEDAIKAALNPEQGDWLYFVTVDPVTRETKFTSSYQKFLKFKAQFQANLDAQKGSATASPNAS